MAINSNVIYLDSNATTQVFPSALKAALSAMRDDFGNPSSVHSSGIQAKAIMDKVRKKANDILGCDLGRLLFVSGATEGIQTAVFSALIALRDRAAQGDNVGRLILYGATEHKAVPESLHHWNYLLQLGFDLQVIPVDQEGRHDLDFLRRHAPNAGLICTMAANNETGVITDLQSIEKILLTCNAYWLVDCVQALGKLPLKLSQYRIDYAPFSGHKLYAPKGVGLLYVRDGAPFTPLLAGGGQESSLRSGTENVSGIAALGAVLEAIDDGISFRDHSTLQQFRMQLLSALYEAFPNLVLNVPLSNSLPTTLNFSVPSLSSKEMLDLFDAADMRVSAGSACGAAKAQPSFVLIAMDLPEWQTANAVRLSFGPATEVEIINEACRRIRACGVAMRQTCMMSSGAEPLPSDGVIQLTNGSVRTWIIADAKSKQCTIIDPTPELIERIHQYVSCQNYTVISINLSEQQSVLVKAREKLIPLLGSAINSQLSLQKICVNLKDGTTTEVIHFGNKFLACINDLETSSAAYFLCEPPLSKQAVATSTISDQEALIMKVKIAFCGNTFDSKPTTWSTKITKCIDSQTLLCSMYDLDKRLVSTIIPDRLFSIDERTIHTNEMQSFMTSHPDTIIVDVREPYEQNISAIVYPERAKLVHMPLSRLVNGITQWLNPNEKKRPPLLFVCRTGNRSAQAMQCLQRLGYDNAWHLAGGMALWKYSAS